MKRIPMGYFSDNRLGDIAAAVTTTLEDIENNAVTVLEKVAEDLFMPLLLGSGCCLMSGILAFYRFIGLGVSLLIYVGIQKAGKRLSPKRQEAQVNLVTGVLEYVQGMGVVKKPFGLGRNFRKGGMNAAIEESADANIRLERVFSSLIGIPI